MSLGFERFLVLPAALLAVLLLRLDFDRKVVHVDLLLGLLSFLAREEAVIPIGELVLIGLIEGFIVLSAFLELARRDLAELLSEILHLNNHDVRIELMELLDAELQVDGAVVDLFQSLLLSPRHLSALPEGLLSLFVHVDQRLQLDIEEFVVQTVKRSFITFV